MIKEDIIKKIVETAGDESCLENEPMKNHTTFRIGGPARLFVIPKTIDVLRAVINLCKQNDVRTFILGNGSNLLVSDKGFEGVVIQIYRNMNEIVVDGNKITVNAGALLSAIAAKALDNSLKGFEFASGIPGTIGGAVVMNAGAYGGEMCQVVSEVTVLTKDNEIQVLHKNELDFGYRKSAVMARGDIVLSAVLELEKGDREQIRSTMEELKEKRISKQPLQFPSAGSTFKRPDGSFAGKLIMEAGFKGYSVGGAQVSEKHCGFVINKGNATAADVIELTNQIKNKIYAEKNIMLELEVKLLGEF